MADVKQFLDRELELDMMQVKSIQVHNVRHVIYMTMHSEEVAARIASNHHLKHFMNCEGKQLAVPLPIYVDSCAVDVRLHGLPEEIEAHTIISHMGQYGEVISIRNDVWRSFFPGLSNGVRVVRMKLTHPIPSYITVAEETTFVSYFSQTRTCRNCGGKDHPKQRCSEAAASIANKQPLQPVKSNVTQHPPPLSAKQWPSLSKPETVGKNKTKQQANNKLDSKRQRSIESDTSSTNAPKRIAPIAPPIPVSSESDSSVVDSDVPPAAALGYRRGSYSHIDDPDLRQQYIEEKSQRIEELIRQGCTL